MRIGNFHLDKNQINVLVFGLLVLLLPVAVYLAGTVTNTTRKAAPTASLSFVAKNQSGTVIGQNPDTSYTFNQGEKVTLDVMLTTGTNQVEMALMTIDYPGNILSINYDPTPASQDPLTGIGMHLTTDLYCGVNENPFDANNYLGDAWFRGVEVNETTHQPTGSLRILCGAGSNSVPFTPLRSAPAGQTTKIATITFTVGQPTNSSDIIFRINSADVNASPTLLTALGCRQATEACGNDNTCIEAVPQCQNNLNANQTTGITFTTNASQSEPSIDLSTASTTVNNGSTFNVEIRANSSGQAISGVDAVLEYDNPFFQVVSVTPNTASTVFTSFQNDKFANFFNNNYPAGSGKGRVDIAALIDPNDLDGVIMTNELIATVQFRAVGVTTPQSTIAVFIDPDITKRNSDANIAVFGSGTDILSATRNLNMTVSGTLSPTATPTRTPTPTPTTGPNTPTPTQIPPTNTPTPTVGPQVSISFRIDLQGRNWRTNILNRLTNLYVFVNGVENQSKRTLNKTSNSTTGLISNALTLNAGTYEFIVQPKGFLNQAVTQAVSGTNSEIGSSLSQFKGGDLDNSGKVTGADYNFMLSFFKKDTSSTDGDIASIIMADLDGSEQVNSLDFSLLLSNWNRCGAYEDSNADGIVDTKYDTANPCN